MSLNVRGIVPACVLTLDADGRFDERAYRRYLQWLLPQGPVALAINADTGEGPHLWPEEREVGSSRVDLQACKLEYSIVSPK